MKVTAKINHGKVKSIDKAMQNALEGAMAALRNDLIQSQTMPFEHGELQNRSMSVDKSKIASGRIRLNTDTPYARRLYFHPEYNFRKEDNPHAQGRWLDTYLDGPKKEYFSKAYKLILKKSGEV